MHRIDAAGHENNRFTNGDPTTDKPATEVDAAWCTAVQEEPAAVIEHFLPGGLQKGNNTQLLAAILAGLGGRLPLNGTALNSQKLEGRSASHFAERYTLTFSAAAKPQAFPGGLALGILQGSGWPESSGMLVCAKVDNSSMVQMFVGGLAAIELPKLYVRQWNDAANVWWDWGVFTPGAMS